MSDEQDDNAEEIAFIADALAKVDHTTTMGGWKHRRMAKLFLVAQKAMHDYRWKDMQERTDD